MGKIGLLVCLTLLLTGCLHYTVQPVEITDTLKPTFKINEGVLFMEAAHFSTLSFYKVVDATREAVWEISAKNRGRPAYITEVTYGETPSGYEEITKANPLEVRQIYEIFIHYGDFGGGPSFEIIDKNGKLEIRMLGK